MKRNLRGKIREYIQSEEGKIGAKTPLTLGVAAGGLLLAHAIVGTVCRNISRRSRDVHTAKGG